MVWKWSIFVIVTRMVFCHGFAPFRPQIQSSVSKIRFQGGLHASRSAYKIAFQAFDCHRIEFPDAYRALKYLALPVGEYSLLNLSVVHRTDDPEKFELEFPLRFLAQNTASSHSKSEEAISDIFKVLSEYALYTYVSVCSLPGVGEIRMESQSFRLAKCQNKTQWSFALSSPTFFPPDHDSPLDVPEYKPLKIPDWFFDINHPELFFIQPKFRAKLKWDPFALHHHSSSSRSNWFDWWKDEQQNGLNTQRGLSVGLDVHVGASVEIHPSSPFHHHLSGSLVRFLLEKGISLALSQFLRTKRKEFAAALVKDSSRVL